MEVSGERLKSEAIRLSRVHRKLVDHKTELLLKFERLLIDSTSDD